MICEEEEDVNSARACQGLVDALSVGSNVPSCPPHLSGL